MTDTEKPRIDTLDPQEFAKNIQCKGPFVWAVIYEDEKYYRFKDGTKSSLLMTGNAQNQEKYKNFVAYVVKMGDECYKSKDGQDLPRRCEVGQWIVLPRHEGVQVTYKGYPLIILYDDRVLGTVDNPELFIKD